MIAASRSWKLALAAALLVTGVAADAQRTGSRIGKDAEASDGLTILRDIAECTVDRQPAFVRSWLNLLPGTPDERALVTGMTGDMSACLDDDQLVMDNKQISFQPAALRRPVAHALVRKIMRASGDKPTPAADLTPWFAASLPADGRFDQQAIAVQDFGHCIATTAWSDSLALLAADAGSAGERAAIGRLKPALGPCLTEDVEVKLTIPTIREILAEPVYHILTGSPATAAATQR